MPTADAGNPSASARSFTMQGAPNKSWKTGEKQPHPFGHDRMLQFDPSSLSSCYPLMISAVVPRPIALVSSLSAEGVGNLAPFSYFTVISHDPPCVMFSVCRKPSGDKKDTWANIEATGEFVVNVINDWFVNAANHTCGNFQPDEDEFDLSGLTRVSSTKVKPPRVAESAFHMECKLRERVFVFCVLCHPTLRHHYDVENDQGKVTATAVVGEVIMFHMHEDVADLEWEGKPKIDMSRYQPISRLGGNTYGRTETGFDMPRPDRPPQGRSS